MEGKSQLEAFDELVARQVNQTLQKASVATAVMGLGSGLILFLLIHFQIVRDIEAPVIWALSGGLYAVMIWLLARAQKIQRKIIWFVMLGFCSFPSVIYVIAFFMLPSGTATFITGPPGYLYFFMIVLTGFAFDFKLSVAAGIYSAIQFSLATELALPYLKFLRHPDPLLLQDFTQGSFYHFKSLTMAMTGITVGIVGRHVRTLIQDILTKERETSMVTRLFGQFVSNEVKDKILANAGSIGQGEKKIIAILFCDIRGFTTFSERIQPELVVEYLNEYLDAMVRAINSAGGTIDKFIGDAIMAVFGGVLPVDNCCDAALAASLLMRASLAELNEIRGARGLDPIRNGIGLHFGEVLQGAIGSAERKDFTVIGDTVNSASRIEGLCKDFSTDLIFSDAVFAGASPAVQQRCRRVGEAKVKGREQEIVLWTID